MVRGRGRRDEPLSRRPRELTTFGNARRIRIAFVNGRGEIRKCHRVSSFFFVSAFASRASGHSSRKTAMSSELRPQSKASQPRDLNRRSKNEQKGCCVSSANRAPSYDSLLGSACCRRQDTRCPARIPLEPFMQLDFTPMTNHAAEDDQDSVEQAHESLEAPHVALPTTPQVTTHAAGTALPIHDVARLFPTMYGQEFDDLKVDIRQHGLREPIVTFQGSIIDGVNRYRACRDLEQPFQTKKWDEQGTLEEFVISQNMHRRHLSTTQRAAIGADLLKLRSRKAGQHDEVPGHDAPRANLPAGGGRARDEMADLMQVSSRSIGSAQKVFDQGVPELTQMVRRDEVSVSAAEAVASLPAEKQQEIAKKGPGAVKEVAKRNRRERTKRSPEAIAQKTTSKKSSSLNAGDGGSQNEAVEPVEDRADKDDAFLRDILHRAGVPDSPVFAMDVRFAYSLNTLLQTMLDDRERSVRAQNLSPTESPLFVVLTRVIQYTDASAWTACDSCGPAQPARTSCTSCRGAGYSIRASPMRNAGKSHAAGPTNSNSAPAHTQSEGRRHANEQAAAESGVA